MVKKFAIVAVLGTLGLLWVGPSAAAVPSGPQGHWTATDRVDGSDLQLTIGGGRNPQVTLRDNGGTICGPDASGELMAVIARGRGVRTGDDVTVDLTVTCLSSPPTTVAVIPVTFSASSNRMMTDSTGQDWAR
ncbi:MAG: hypothetical protein OEU32_03770 [Acidimicrobiia bacterium]|nr:hypothetical protein [Acidimicrobiia bacterium]